MERNYKEIGKRIKALRLKKNIAQKDLAAMLGVNKTAVCNWEKETHYPDKDNLVKLSVNLGVTTDYLLTGINETQSNTESPRKDTKKSGTNSTQEEIIMQNKIVGILNGLVGTEIVIKAVSSNFRCLLNLKPGDIIVSNGADVKSNYDSVNIYFGGSEFPFDFINIREVQYKDISKKQIYEVSITYYDDSFIEIYRKDIYELSGYIRW